MSKFRLISLFAALFLLASATQVNEHDVAGAVRDSGNRSKTVPASIDGKPDTATGLIRIPFSSSAELASLARELDIWEVDHDQGYVVVWLDGRRSDGLAGEDTAFDLIRPHSAYPTTIPDYPCYRTVDELYAQLAIWAQDYPELTDLRSIGTSHEGRPLQAIRVTNEATGGNKPIFVLMANIHGRELITNEVAMVFVQRLLEDYGTVADVTWLLDHHRIEVIVTANPDGHVKNEAGQPWAWWRKNTNPTYGCSGGQYGVDLNRNSSFLWGGAGVDPCDLTYQGPSATSETETQAIQAFLSGLFPDQRADDLTSPAPADASGLFITLHSYGDLVLWPWGHTYAAAPNASQLAMLGRRMAAFNGYTPQQASDLYPTTGTTDDWTYGELGVASYTFEIGQSFYPSCELYSALIEPNLDALFYAAKVAGTPYSTPFGPDATDLSTGLSADAGHLRLTVNATIDDRFNGGRPVVAAEAYVGPPPGEGGTPYPLAPVDGAFDSAVEDVEGQWPASSPERAIVLVRGRDADGVWGPFSAAFLDGDLGWQGSGASAAGVPGNLVTHTLNIVNATPISQTLTIFGEGAAWPVTVEPTRTTVLPTDFRGVTVTVSIPAQRDLLAPKDGMTLTMQSESESSFLRSIRVETRALWRQIYMPVTVRDFGP